jgi:hypothetical protein
MIKDWQTKKDSGKDEERGNKLNFLDTHKYEYRKKRLRKSKKEQARKDNTTENIRIREKHVMLH